MNNRYLLLAIGLAASLIFLTLEPLVARTPRSSVRRSTSRVVKAGDSTRTDAADSLASPPLPQPADIRVAWFEGNVVLLDSAGTIPVAIGMPLDSFAVLRLDRKANVQIAVNGAVAAFGRKGRVPVKDALRATYGRHNAEVAAALAYLARYAHLTVSGAIDPVTVQSAIEAVLGIRAMMRTVPTATVPSPVILEPRATSVTRGPLRFRWTGIGDSTTRFLVTVRDDRGSEVFVAQTADTFLVWDGATLFIDREYTWTLALADDPAQQQEARFRRVDDIVGMKIEGGESRIRTELGSENPALPLVLGAHFAQHGLHGDAARMFSAAASRTPEHSMRFTRLAREQYQMNVGLTESELEQAFPTIAGRAD